MISQYPTVQFIEAGNTTVHPTHGGITGHIDGTDYVDAEELDGIAVLIDGKEVTRTKSGGKFFISDVAKGVHTIEIDPGELPLELVTSKSTINAEVAPGALTSLTFSVETEYGAAGQVTGRDAKAQSSFLLIVKNSKGKEVTRAQTNEFGYFRFDHLKPGRYSIVHINEDETETSTLKHFTIQNDYIFGVDIKVKE